MRLQIVFLCFAFIFLLPSCRSEDQATPSGSVNLMVTVPDAYVDRYRAFADVFMAENENVSVRVEGMNRLIGNDPDPARILAQSSDIFPSNVAFADDWQSLTLDLTPFANAADFDAADFPVGVLTAADGTIRHLPVGFDLFFVAYNKALFDNASLAYPTPDWTWEEFVSLAAQLTVRYGDVTAQYGWADGFNPLGLVGAGLSEPLTDYTTDPPSSQLTESDVITAVTRYLDLFGEDGVAFMPKDLSTASGETQSQINQRRVAMWLANSNEIASYTNLDVGVLPLPIVANQVERRLNLFSQGFAVSPATQHPQEAWRLLEFLSRQPGYHEDAMPARSSVRQAANYWDGIPSEVASLVENYLDDSFEFPHAPIRQALIQAVFVSLTEETDLLAAITQAESAVQQGVSIDADPLTSVVSSPVAEVVTGNILFITDSANFYRHQTLARAFEQENPTLQIEVESPQWIAFSGTAFRSMDRAYGGRQADCFVYGPLQSNAEAARVLPLDELLNLESAFKPDDFFPLTQNAFSYDGALVALPYQFTVPLIGYDPTLFDAMGVSYPQSGWTLDEFLEASLRLTTGEGDEKQYGYVPSRADFLDAWIFLHAFGVELLDRSVEPATADFTSPTVADALRWFVALSSTHGIKPNYGTTGYDLSPGSGMENMADRGILFAARRGAMWWDSGSEIEGPGSSPTAAIEERKYTTFPVAPNTEVVLPVELTGLYISAQTEERQACWQWLVYLLEHDPGFGIPAYRPMAQSEEFRLRAGPAATVMLQSAEQTNQQQLEIAPEWMQLRRWYSIALARAMEGNLTAEEALLATQVEFETYRQCVIQRELFEPTDEQERVFECAAPASPYVILGEE